MGAFSVWNFLRSLTRHQAEVLDDIFHSFLQGLDRRQGISLLELIGRSHLIPSCGKVGLHGLLHIVGHSQLKVLENVIVGVAEIINNIKVKTSLT